MGQYFAPINLTKKEWMYSHDYDNGLKIMEHSWLGNNFVGVILDLLKPGKSWHKNRIVWSSDYMDEEEFLSEQCNFGEKAPTSVIKYSDSGNEYTHTLYSFAGENFKKLVLKGKKEYTYKTFKYLVNHSLQQYVNFDNCPFTMEEWDNKPYKSVVNPLPLLTVSGHGRGGGCYNDEGGREFIGTWAGHIISLEKEVPAGYLEIKPGFIER